MGKSTTSWQRNSKCVAKLGFYPYFRVKVGIKNDTVNDTIVSFTVSVMGWVMGFEPTNTGTTIRCLRPLGDTHHINLISAEKWHARRDSNP